MTPKVVPVFVAGMVTAGIVARIRPGPAAAWPWFAALAGSSGSRADRDQRAGLDRPPVVLDRPPSPLP
jgi:hypothetical protein